ncbi:MAG: sugar phosphate isomerase/epimerase family protein [Lachnospiraceae bacterium]
MELGIHLSSYTKNWKDCGFGYMEHAARTGYTAVELPLMNPDTYDTAKAKELLKKYHLNCTCGTGVNFMEDPSSTDLEIRKKGKERLKKCIDIAAKLETDCLGGVLYAPWGLKKSRMQAQENYKIAAESMSEIAEYGKQYGITISLEILNRYESYFMNTVAEGQEFLKEIGNQNVKLHFDTFHSYIEETSIKEAIRTGQEDIYHVHLCDNNRCAPGTGAICWKEVKEGLEEIGYNRYVMVENFILPNTEAGMETCIWRESGRTVYENAEIAYCFLSNLFKGKIERR